MWPCLTSVTLVTETGLEILKANLKHDTLVKKKIDVYLRKSYVFGVAFLLFYMSFFFLWVLSSSFLVLLGFGWFYLFGYLYLVILFRFYRFWLSGLFLCLVSRGYIWLLQYVNGVFVPMRFLCPPLSDFMHGGHSVFRWPFVSFLSYWFWWNHLSHILRSLFISFLLSVCLFPFSYRFLALG